MRNTAVGWVVWMALLLPSLLLADGPRVALDASALVEDLRDTRSVAASVEQDIQHALETLTRHAASLKAAGCSKTSTDAACRDRKAQLRTAYLQLLDAVEARLPALKASVQQIVSGLEHRMAQEGEASSAALQEELLAGSTNGGAANRPRLQGVSGSRLSESLGKLQKLVSNASDRQVPLRAVQADLYLDMRESLAVIDLLQTDIDRTRILAEVQLGEMQLSSAQLDAAQEAMSLLLPEREPFLPDSGQLPEPEQDFTSPLEL